MAVIVIGSDSFNAYLDLTAANTYFNGRAGGSAWTSYTNGAETANDKGRALVSATRMLDLQSWVGAKTSPSQPMEWPRDGVTDRDGVAVANTVIPADIQAACCELALALLLDPSLQESTSGSSSNTKKLEAKGVSIEYFGPVQGSRFPTAAYERFAFYLATTSASNGYVGSKAFGICDWPAALAACSVCGCAECCCPQVWPHTYDLVRQ